MLELSDLEEMFWRGMSPVHDTQRLVLSPEEIVKYNADLDGFMKNRFPEQWIDDETAHEVADAIFAATGNVFLRMSRAGDTMAAHPPESKRIIYLILSIHDAEQLMAIYDSVQQHITLH